MFDKLLKRVNLNIATVRRMIETNDKLKGIVFGKDSAIKQELDDNEKFTELREVVPNEIEWQVYDHCAVVTRLYAIYERFVEDLITDWLGLIPNLVSDYSDLPDRIKNTHREGVGRLMVDLNKSRFKHLSVEKVVRGLLYGVAGNETYELIPDAFLLHEQNLRKDVLDKLFADAGIENAWKWVINHRGIKNFLEEIRGDQNTAEGELNQLVAYRNEAAHGAVDQILGTQELLDMGDFVENLCQALVELVTYQVIFKQAVIGQAREIGTIRHWLDDQKVARAKIKAVTLSVGKTIFLVKDSSSYCLLATIESIRDDEITKEQVEITTEKDVNLKFDCDAKKGLSIYVIE
ncbi:hypothetical protein H6F74_24645 [Trichocoleus sp. FACHB-90]|uniref:MAE_28990/MAE_18760 family HEPN-like nuclease n=1 Tax=Cyanophyceae TaxID=3028117 RepID=UPI001682E0AC|nr:MAE_28990/MAE_18760 family HEPN-like nuclease [Trichocoleus sp. FACHB-90]MBD1929406.1 hypothetical protein [Trichocoleus sp. FACHB-90]